MRTSWKRLTVLILRNPKANDYVLTYSLGEKKVQSLGKQTVLWCNSWRKTSEVLRQQESSVSPVLSQPIPVPYSIYCPGS